MGKDAHRWAAGTPEHLVKEEVLSELCAQV